LASLEGRKLVDPKEPVQIGEARKKKRKEGRKEREEEAGKSSGRGRGKILSFRRF